MLTVVNIFCYWYSGDGGQLNITVHVTLCQPIVFVCVLVRLIKSIQNCNAYSSNAVGCQKGHSLSIELAGHLSTNNSYNQGCGLGLDVSVSRRSRDVPTSRFGLVSRKNCQRLGLVSVSGGRRLGLVSISANYISCPKPIFGQIVQAIKRTQCERALDAGGSEALTFSYQISALSKSCYYHIRELRCLRPYLDFKTACTIATSIVHSKLDYCKSLYYNLSQSQIKKNSRTSRSLLLVLLPERQNLFTSLLFWNCYTGWK